MSHLRRHVALFGNEHDFLEAARDCVRAGATIVGFCGRIENGGVTTTIAPCVILTV